MGLICMCVPPTEPKKLMGGTLKENLTAQRAEEGPGRYT